MLSRRQLLSRWGLLLGVLPGWHVLSEQRMLLSGQGILLSRWGLLP
jgi:hypothetical protein